MFAYLLVLLGVASRYLVAGPLAVAELHGRHRFAALLRRAPLVARDAGACGHPHGQRFRLTTYVYHYPFHWQGYVITWAWYAAAMVLGQILLHAKTTFVRGAAAALLGPTSFFIVSNYGVWASGMNGYPHTLAGLVTCFVAAIPFYRNDLLATSIVLAVALGAPVLVRRLRAPLATNTPGLPDSKGTSQLCQPANALTAAASILSSACFSPHRPAFETIRDAASSPLSCALYCSTRIRSSCSTVARCAACAAIAYHARDQQYSFRHFL